MMTASPLGARDRARVNYERDSGKTDARSPKAATVSPSGSLSAGADPLASNTVMTAKISLDRIAHIRGLTSQGRSGDALHTYA
jgi:hypothetical protein